MPRNIVVKSRFNPDEYLPFAAACKAADIPQSKVLRDLASGWLDDLTARQEAERLAIYLGDHRGAKQNDRRQQPQKKWPGTGLNVALFPSQRVNYGSVPRVRMLM